jgi:hypothetical protein
VIIALPLPLPLLMLMLPFALLLLLLFLLLLLLTGLVASADGSLCVSISRDRTGKVFDVLGFDMIMMMKLPYTPGVAEWTYKVSGCE